MRIQAMVGKVLPGGRKRKACEACGQPFECGASQAGCWCEEVKLSPAARAEIAARYGDCLCRKCLEIFAEMRRTE